MVAIHMVFESHQEYGIWIHIAFIHIAIAFEVY